jgi:hypothetical protein
MVWTSEHSGNGFCFLSLFEVIAWGDEAQIRGVTTFLVCTTVYLYGIRLTPL